MINIKGNMMSLGRVKGSRLGRVREVISTDTQI
jgi:hypothetical protein